MPNEFKSELKVTQFVLNQCEARRWSPTDRFLKQAISRLRPHSTEPPSTSGAHVMSKRFIASSLVTHFKNEVEKAKAEAAIAARAQVAEGGGFKPSCRIALTNWPDVHAEVRYEMTRLS